jgi:RHS repeat-associated protein
MTMPVSTMSNYAYNQEHELTSFTKTGGTSASYVYNGDGLRMSKTVNSSAEGFVWDISQGMPLIIQDGTTRYLTGPDGLPIEQVDGSGNVSYYLQDQLGSTRGLIDSSGTITARCTFGPYGDVKGQTGATTLFGYAGQYTDSESGLQYLRARYYDPSTQQFLTVDPAQDVTQQPYAYAAGNPLRYADPAGLCAANTGRNRDAGWKQCTMPRPMTDADLPMTRRQVWYRRIGEEKVELELRIYSPYTVKSINVLWILSVLPPVGGTEAEGGFIAVGRKHPPTEYRFSLGEQTLRKGRLGVFQISAQGVFVIAGQRVPRDLEFMGCTIID